ncbi:MAG: hypothetical protein KDJ67_16740 [Nitratireductor sp.]|nr:hypothetical protein [Nitratireductor sp.]
MISVPAKRTHRGILLAALAILVALPLAAWVWNPAMMLVVGFELASLTQRNGGPPGDCSGQWSLSIDASRPWLVPFYPETNATYRLMVLDANAGDDSLDFTLSGTLPRARYSSLHVYDADTAEILLARTGEELAEGTSSDWQLTLQQATKGTDARAIALIRPGARRLAFVWRSYLPQGEETLPRITAINSSTGAALENCRNRFTLPQTVTDREAQRQRDTVLANMANQQRDMQSSGVGFPIRFYVRHAASTPFFANQHITYAFAPLLRDEGPALIRFRPPPGLRYWSACIGGLRETSTSACLADTEVSIGEEGMAYFLVGPKTDALEQLAANNGWNFLRSDWFMGNRIFILRELITQTPPPGARLFANLPDFDNAKPLDVQFADGLLGEFAPVGRYLR